jgi:hypothetical protein
MVAPIDFNDCIHPGTKLAELVALADEGLAPLVS